MVGLMMPNLRELSLPLTFSTTTLDAVSSKFSELTKLNLTLCIPAASPTAALHSLQLPRLRSLWMTLRGLDDVTGVWDGSSSELCQLDDLRIQGRYAIPDEVVRICRFFRSSSITRLFLKVDVLHGPLIDMLAASFPHLHNLCLHARYLIRAGTVLGHTMHVVSHESSLNSFA